MTILDARRLRCAWVVERAGQWPRSVSAAVAACSLALAGCSVVSDQSGLPKTIGETTSGYGYVPLDGLAVDQTLKADSCKPQGATWLPLLQSLPDLSVRYTVADFEPSGSLSFGPAKITASGKVYRAVLDYANVDAIPENFYIRKYVKEKVGPAKPAPLRAPLNDGDKVVAYEVILDDGAPAAIAPPSEPRVKSYADQGYDAVTIPVYVGIGMRLTADVRALKSGVALSSLASIGAEAEADALTGTLTVQTLGINGKSIATVLPLPSKLDQTTIENGVLALGSSRASIYGASTSTGDVTSTPRVVGLYSPIGTDPLLINAVYSELSKNRPKWDHPCSVPNSQQATSGVANPSAASHAAKKTATAKKQGA